MKIIHTLFFKMFVAFWLSMLAIVASVMLLDDYLEDQPANIGWHDHTHRSKQNQPLGPPHRFIQKKLYEIQNATHAELAPLLSQTPAEVDLYLLDGDGHDFLSRDVPNEVSTTAGQLERRRRGFSASDRQRVIALHTYRRDLGPLRAVFVIRPPESRAIRLLAGNPGMFMLLAAGISALVCLFLSRRLSAPLGALRKASDEFAKGNLDARVEVMRGGGVEAAELAKDFNRMAQQLKDRIESQKRLLSDVSHELRSPLSRLQVATALAQKNPDSQAQYLQRIASETERLDTLVQQLLTSQSQHAGDEIHIDLVALLHQLVENTQFEGGHRGVTLHFVAATEEAVVASWGENLHRALENILRNALQHSPDNAPINITLQPGATGDGECWRIEVRDQGPGVGDDQLERIFDAFYREDKVRGHGGGYGLGLAIARHAIEQQGGTIHAANANPGLLVSIKIPRETKV